MEYCIIADGSCDLGHDKASETGVGLVPFYVSFDEVNYKKEGVEVEVRHFYDELVAHPDVFPKTSMPSVQDYLDIYEPIVKEGKAIISICISAKFSGSYNSAMNAKAMIIEEYPDAKIEVIDSTLNTVTEGRYVLEAVKMLKDGVSFEESVSKLEEIKETGRIFFTIGNMDYLVHGGRVGKLLGGAVSKLGIKPIIVMKEGEIFSSGIARSRKKSMDKTISIVKEHFEKNNLSADDYEFSVGYGYDYDEAVEFRDKFIELLKTYSSIETVDIYQIGATVSVHTGPYPIGVGLVRKYNK